MIWLWAYLTIGVLNCLQFAFTGGSVVRPGFSSPVEALFYLLLWPVQLLFFIVVLVNSATSRILERIFR